jgi:hypothetical protein
MTWMPTRTVNFTLDYAMSAPCPLTISVVMVAANGIGKAVAL